MNLTTYSEIRKLKGKFLIGLKDNEVYLVTSATNLKVVLNKGITFLTSIFFETKQKNYALLETVIIDTIHYPLRDVVVKGVGTVVVGTEGLSKALNPNDNWNEVSIQAENIDNHIYFYVPDEMILKPIKELSEYVNANS